MLIFALALALSAVMSALWPRMTRRASTPL